MADSIHDVSAAALTNWVADELSEATLILSLALVIELSESDDKSNLRYEIAMGEPSTLSTELLP